MVKHGSHMNIVVFFAILGTKLGQENFNRMDRVNT